MKRSPVNDAAADLLDMIKASPSVVAELDALRDRVEAATTAAIEAGFEKERKYTEAQLAGEQEKLRTLKEEVELKQLEVELAREALAELEAKIESQTADLEREVDRRIQDALEKPSSVLADSALLRAILPRPQTFTTPAAVSHRFHPIVRFGEDPNLNQTGKKCSSAQQLGKKLRRNMKAVGCAGDAGKRIHAAVAGKLLPVLTGFNAVMAAEAYANAVCGGRLFCVRVPPDATEASMLFDVGGTPDGDGVAAGQQSLAAVIDAASAIKKPVVVLFEGVNRAPTESYFLPVLQAIFHGRRLSIVDRSSGGKIWSSGADGQFLIPIATAVEGATTLPISQDVWSRSILVEIDGVFADGEFDEATELEFDGGLFGVAAFDNDVLEDLFDSFPEFDASRTAAERFAGGLSHFVEPSAPSNILLESVIETILLPLISLTDRPDERDSLVERVAEYLAGMDVPADGLEARVGNIRSRIA